MTADVLLVLLVEQQLLDRLAADLGDLALEVAHAGLARVVAHDVQERRIRHLQLLVLQAVVLHLLRHQVAPPDVDLLVFGVAGQTDDFHAIEQRRRDVQAVRRAHEHHLGQVEIDLQVMIVEGRVLLRIEHFQQRRGRIAAEVHRHLVDFIEQEQRIVHARLRHVLHDLAGHRADVGAAMAADLGLIAHAAQRHAHELAVGRARDALAERGLAHARRARPGTGSGRSASRRAAAPRGTRRCAP